MPEPREFTVVIEQDEAGWFVASVPDLRGCHTQGATLDELLANVRDAIEVCLPDQIEDGPPGRFVGVYRVTV